MNINKEIIRIESISKTFSQDKEKVTKAISDISFSVRENEFVSILGPSGCGKTTLLRIISGLLKPSSGEIIKSNNQEQNFLKFVFQEYNKSLFPWLSVYENVAFGLKLNKKNSKTDINKEVEKFLEIVKLENYQKHYPWELSGGMQQRVAIARALICKPKLLLMDEPFGSLDALSRFELENDLLQLWKDFNLTIVFVTHDIEEAIYLSDRVILLSLSPSSVMEDIKISLSRPRKQLETKNSNDFANYRKRIITKVGRKI
jgi:NitT/TauT family transport system ATP-binding protein